MTREFPLFQSHIDLAHSYWKKILRPHDHAIDATCGNGKDTLVLANLLFRIFPHSQESTLIGIDIQSEAIERTRTLLSTHLSEKENARIFLCNQSHAAFPAIAYQAPIRLIVYNFGYLPGGGKSITTVSETSLQSLQAALPLLMPGGAISATCYPGHPEGKIEESALLSFANALDPSQWCVTWHTWPNRILSPTLLFLQKCI
jgi:hypothetical protein